MGHYALGTVVLFHFLVSLKVLQPELKCQLPHLLCISLHYCLPLPCMEWFKANEKEKANLQTNEPKNTFISSVGLKVCLM